MMKLGLVKSSRRLLSCSIVGRRQNTDLTIFVLIMTPLDNTAMNGYTKLHLHDNLIAVSVFEIH